MASKYVNEHAGALSDVTAAGSAVTFTRVTPGAVSDSTDVASGSTTTTVEGYAVESEGMRDTAVREGVSGGFLFHTAGLTHRADVTLFFTPSTIGESPRVDDTLTWAGEGLTVQSVQLLAPDGVAIAATVECKR